MPSWPQTLTTGSAVCRILNLPGSYPVWLFFSLFCKLTYSRCLFYKPGIQSSAPNPETAVCVSMTSASSAGPKGSASAMEGYPVLCGLEHQAISSLLWKTCCTSHGALPSNAKWEEEEKRMHCTAFLITQCYVCSFSATASSSFIMKVFLGHRQQTKPLYCSVNNYVTDEYCQNFDHLPSW